MALEEISLTVVPEDVGTGRVRQLEIERVGVRGTKYGERWYLEGADEKGNKWTVWLRPREIAFIKRRMLETGRESPKGMVVFLGVETYIGKDGQEKQRVVIERAD